MRPPEPHPSGGFALALRFVAAPASEIVESPSPAPVERPRIPAEPPHASGGDRRRTTRWAKRILVKYRCVSEGVLRDIDPRVGALENISAGGLVLTVRRELPPGAALEVHLPETQLGPPRIAFATVVWSREYLAKPRQWLAGCSFEG